MWRRVVSKEYVVPILGVEVLYRVQWFARIPVPDPTSHITYHFSRSAGSFTAQMQHVQSERPVTATPQGVISQTTINLALTAVRTTYLTPYSRVAQTSHTSRDNLKILGDGRTWSKLKCEGPQMLGVTVATATWHQELVHKFKQKFFIFFNSCKCSKEEENVNKWPVIKYKCGLLIGNNNP